MPVCLPCECGEFSVLFQCRKREANWKVSEGVAPRDQRPLVLGSQLAAFLSPTVPLSPSGGTGAHVSGTSISRPFLGKIFQAWSSLAYLTASGYQLHDELC